MQNLKNTLQKFESIVLVCTFFYVSMPDLIYVWKHDVKGKYIKIFFLGILQNYESQKGEFYVIANYA